MRYVRPPERSRFHKKPKKHRKAELAGLPGFMPHDMVRAHIRSLEAMGLPRVSIARDAGCTDESLCQLMLGRTERIRTRWGAALLNVDFHPNERQGHVLAIGAIRRARALHALGWGWPTLGEHTPGVTVTAIRQMAQPGHEARILSWDTWLALHDAYEKLSGTVATEGRTSLARNHAAKNGWAPPLDWEGHDIDDPRVIVVPSGPPAPPSMLEVAEARRQEVARLTGQGCSIAEIADRMGISQRQVERCRRALKAGVSEGWDISA